MTTPADVPPEDRDWTFVIRDGCEECGFTPQEPQSTGERLRATIPAWRQALAGVGASVRPAPAVWSPVEYGCHVRDTCRLFRQRLALMLDQDNPVFANWDQDATAVEDDYFHQAAHQVADEIATEAEATATAFEAVGAQQWQRPGRRSNGSLFTVDTFAVYFLHDIEHHVHDVESGPGVSS
jgi:DinB superfamily